MVLRTNENLPIKTKYKKKLRKVQFQRMQKTILQDSDQLLTLIETNASE